MTQPDHVPLQDTDRVRPSRLLPHPGAWRMDRPGDQLTLTPPVGQGFGSAGPDVGYGLKLARRLEHDLQLGEGEHAEDAVMGCFACGARRAAVFGRAPVIHDMRWAYGLWGYLGGAPAELVAARARLFRGAAEDYQKQRRIAAAVKTEALAVDPASVISRLGEWRELISI